MAYRYFIVVFISLQLLMQTASAQYESFQHKGEIGLAIGGAQYYGDLNPYHKMNDIGLSASAFYLHNFNNYFGARLTLGYAHLGYSDAKNRVNTAYFIRNLSFDNDIWELTLSGSFNFFDFVPGIKGKKFTPYMTFGAGIIKTNPYTYLLTEGVNQKIYLRPLGTEGQFSYGSNKTYGKTAVVFPLTFGFKYAVSEKINVFAEAGYRFTTTDYLDDVSTVYAGEGAFAVGNYNGNATKMYYANVLQDRSNIVNRKGVRIGTKGMQRGNGTAKDGYVIGQIGISFNINGYICPKGD